MDGVSAAASAVAIIELTGKAVLFLSSIKHAPKDRKMCAIEASNLLKLLVDLRFRLEEAQPHEPWYTAVRTLAVENGPFDQYKQALEKLQSKITEGHFLKKLGDALVWPLVKEDVADITSRMERLKTFVLIALENDHMKLSRAIKDDTTCLRDSIMALEGQVSTMQAIQSRQRYLEVMEWISPIDHWVTQSDTIARRQEGTGQWILDSDAFTNWLHTPNAILLCPGIPGAGKTVVAAIAVDHISKLARRNKVALACLYCDYKTQNGTRVVDLFAAVLKQILQSRLSLPMSLTKLYEDHSERNTRMSLQELLSVLHAELANLQPTYLVVDALDECSDKQGTRSGFMEELRKFPNSTDVRLMVTSRFVSDVMEAFPDALKLEVRASHDDVKRYVAGQVSRLPRCVRRDDDLQREVQDSIAQAVDGMFLLAQLYIETLLDQKSKAQIKKSLSKLFKGPAALEKAYDAAIERLETQLPGDVALAKSAFSWITSAQRQLTTKELRHALAVEPNTRQLDHDNILDIEDIISVCAGLIAVDDESGIIRLVHYTTQKYFEGILPKWNQTFQQEIASTCLTYLCFDTFTTRSCPNHADHENRREQNLFLNYAASYWGHHTKPVQKEVTDLAVAFLQCDNKVCCALQASSTGAHRHAGYSQTHCRQANGLHLVAGFGLLHLFAPLLLARDDFEVDSKDGYSRTPLSWAAESGHEAIVRLLLARNDVEADSRSGLGETPLSWAARHGHEAVVELLLRRDDVEADSKTISRLYPVAWSFRTGRPEVETLHLVDGGMTPLAWAARNGHEAIVKLLLARDDIKASSRTGLGRTPLSWATAKGQQEIVKLLLLQDEVYVNPSDAFIPRETPLSWAARNGDEAILKLLLAHNNVEADANDQDAQAPWESESSYPGIILRTESGQSICFDDMSI